ncbi:MAG: 2-C-methyl-D-erythritol 4-phosphate cytidylyltransferase [Atopobiaceae bacterium]|nr:2-C-methyl-D-erythritol 4-phosphate cytidylyltransferase [Atopobiaceae bacterium]
MSVSSTCAKVFTRPRPSRLTKHESKADTIAVIVAGGIGERFGYPAGKQFVSVCGLPLMSWSILAFDHSPSIAQIVIACSDEKRSAVQNSVLGSLVLHKPVLFATSGTTRQESVYNALQVVPAGYEFISVHDAVRPLIEVETIEQVIGIVRKSPKIAGAILAHRSTDTLKRVDGVTILDTPDRATLWAAQTPQVFKTRTLIEAHEVARQEGYQGTDDSSLVERLGLTVLCVESQRENVKVTYPSDLAIVEATLSRRLVEGATDLGSVK